MATTQRTNTEECNIQWIYLSALWIHGFQICRFNQPWIKDVKEKQILESSKKQNLNVPASNYFPSIYTVLGIIRNLEMIYVQIGIDYICEYYCILYKRNKQSMDFGICRSPRLHPSWIPRDDPIREEWMSSKNNQSGHNKSNTQISLAFLHTDSDPSEKLRKQYHLPLQRKE